MIDREGAALRDENGKIKYVPSSNSHSAMRVTHSRAAASRRCSSTSPMHSDGA